MLMIPARRAAGQRIALLVALFAILAAGPFASGPAAQPPSPEVDRSDSLRAPDRIVGLAIWEWEDPWDPASQPAEVDQVVAWTAAGTVSTGIPSNLAWYRGPRPFETPAGRQPADIVALAISKQKSIYTWYADGGWSRGTPVSLGASQHHPAGTYRIPGGREPTKIVAMAISKTDGHVYTWFRDGRVSVGTPNDLGSHVGPGRQWSEERQYSIPGGRTARQIVGIAIDTRNRVFTWYDDGFVSEGTVLDLGPRSRPPRAGGASALGDPSLGQTGQAVPGASGVGDQEFERLDQALEPGLAPEDELEPSRSPYLYTRHGVLRSTYPDPLPPVGPFEPDTGGPLSPAPTTVDRIVAATGSQDNVVAMGDRFLAVSFNDSVEFYERDGTPLDGFSKAPLRDMFADFLRSGPTKSPTDRRKDVNHYLGFPEECHTYPMTLGYFFCVSSAPYDTRVEYDARGDRWVIYANVRNLVWTSQWGIDPRAPAGGSTEFANGYAPPQRPSKEEGLTKISPELGALARRLKLVAVSRTGDPRDGFFTYAFVQNVYRDWPWMAIDGDMLILSHQGTSRSLRRSPAATFMPLEDLRAGLERPRFLNYYLYDLDAAWRAEPPRQFGELDGHSLLLGKDPAGRWRVFAVPHGERPYEKLPVQSAVIGGSVDTSILGSEKAAYRDGALHLVGQRNDRTHFGTWHDEVVYYRIPLRLEEGRPVFSFEAPGFRRYVWRDPNSTVAPHWSYDYPHVQVNAAGDVLITFGRGGRRSEILNEGAGIVYVLWRHDHSAPDAPVVWERGHPAGGFDHTHRHHPTDPKGGPRVKAIAGAIDPVDPLVFWTLHKFRTYDTTWATLVGAVRP